MNTAQIILLGILQGAAEVLPISSSAHVILAERWMGLDPSTPEMVFFLVMLHAGAMLAVVLFFWKRWKQLSLHFFKQAIFATFLTGLGGLGLKFFLERLIEWSVVNKPGETSLGGQAIEVESLFKSLPLMAAALMSVGILMIYADLKKGKPSSSTQISLRQSFWIGALQAFCLPFRGFSRSGATISAGLLTGLSRETAEDFSFALAVLLTPAVWMVSLHRILKAEPHLTSSLESFLEHSSLFLPGFFGMCLSFASGWVALRWLSDWLKNGRWRYFGFYCICFSCLLTLAQFLVFRG